MSDLVLTKGDTRLLLVTATVDITGSALWWTAKRSRDDADADAVLSKSTADGITITDGPAGEATIALAVADWDAVTAPDRLVWDLQERTVGAVVTTLATGWLVVLPDVRRGSTP